MSFFCSTCNEIANFVCEDCKQFYCSRICAKETGNSNLRVRVITWNMGDNQNTLSDWEKELKENWNIIINHNKYDILLVTLQEDWNGRYGKFGEAISNVLPNNFFFYQEKTTGPPDLTGKPFAVKVYAYVRERVKTKSLKVCLKPVLKVFCAKATVGISLQISDEQQLIFMGSHLPIDTSKEDLGYQKRLKAVKKSLDLVFNKLKTSTTWAAFWAGDMNFRINEKREDQLKLAMQTGFFQEFKEQEITFPPTCKMQTKKKEDCDRPKSDTNNSPSCYHVKTKKGTRTPSFCDRILYAGENVSPIGYNSYADAPSIKFSDHNLVYGDFEIKW